MYKIIKKNDAFGCEKGGTRFEMTLNAILRHLVFIRQRGDIKWWSGGIIMRIIFLERKLWY